MRAMARLRGLAGAGPRAGQTLAGAAVLVAAGYFASRVLGVVRTAAIANAFGTESDLAAYWVAFRLPDLIFQLVAGATLASAFIPTFASVLARDGEDAAWRLASSVINLVFIITAAAAALGFLFAPLLVPLLAPGLGEGTGQEQELRDLAVQLTRLMLLSPIFFSVSGMLMGVLNARRDFFVPALAPVMYNLAIIFGAVFLAGPFGVRGLAIGVVAGSALHLAVQLPALGRVGMRYHLIADMRDAGVQQMARLLGPRIVGLAAAQANFFVTTIFFASLIGDEAISALTYAWLLMMLPHALIAMAISTAVFPEMAETAARQDATGLRGLLGRNLRLILYLTVPASAGLILLGRPIIGLLLQRGAFDAASAELTGGVLSVLALGLFFYAAIEILSRGFYVLQDTRTPMLAGLLSLLLNATLSFALVGPWEGQGLALALTIASGAEVLVLYIVLRRKLGDLDEGAIVRSLLQTFAGTLLLAEVVAFFVLGLGLNDPGPGALVGVIGATALGGAAFLGATVLLRSEEAGMLLGRVLALRRRG